MKKIKDYLYLLFRPKWERRLFKLIKKASCNDKICLDTILYDNCNLENANDKIFKAGVDAMFFCWIGVFNVANSSEVIHRLQMEGDYTDMYLTEDSETLDFTTYAVLYYNQSVRSYIKSLARYISSEQVSLSDRQFLLDLFNYEYLGLVRLWNERQLAIKRMMQVLIDNNVSEEMWYVKDFAGASHEYVFNMKVKLSNEIGLDPHRIIPRVVINNWMSVMAYYASCLY